MREGRAAAMTEANLGVACQGSARMQQCKLCTNGQEAGAPETPRSLEQLDAGCFVPEEPEARIEE